MSINEAGGIIGGALCLLAVIGIFLEGKNLTIWVPYISFKKDPQMQPDE